MKRILGDERGGVTAEFAVLLPTILLTLGIVIGGILLAATRVMLVSAAHDLARLEARGDGELVEQRMAQMPAGTTSRTTREGGLTCVTLTASPGQGPLANLAISARGCAATHTRGIG